MQIIMKTADAVKAFKSKKSVATAIGISRQAVSLWGEYVPENSAQKILRVKPEVEHTVLKHQAAS